MPLDPTPSSRRRFHRLVRIVCAIAAATTAAAAPFLRTLPERSSDAPSGSAFARRTIGVPSPTRQAEAVEEILSGNVPAFLRRPVPLTLSGDVDGRRVEIVLQVSPDYLSVGRDDDFLRMPLNRPSASRIALALDMALPTPRIVDAIHDQAAVRLRPAPLPPGPMMRSSRYFLRHRELVERQRQTASPRPGALIAGQKKDVVLSRRLIGHPDRIAIYGWHRANGEPIQPLSLVHGTRYADYSHGIRLIATTVGVDGSPRSLWEVLADPDLGPILSDEGPFPEALELLREGARGR